MSYLMQSLTKKEEVDELIRNTIDKVLVLRIGRASDPVCMQLDEIVREICFVFLCICCSYARVIESSPKKIYLLSSFSYSSPPRLVSTSLRNKF
jgi:hypothetical protein